MHKKRQKEIFARDIFEVEKNEEFLSVIMSKFHHWIKNAFPWTLLLAGSIQFTSSHPSSPRNSLTSTASPLPPLHAHAHTHRSTLQEFL